MITKAKVTGVTSHDGAGYVKVWIPILNGVEDDNGVPISQYYEAQICIQPGFQYQPQVDDTVFVAFENRRASQPIVIGYLNKEYEQYGNMTLNEITVNSKAQLSQNTTIGNVGYNEISTLRGIDGNIQKQLDELKNDNGVDLTAYTNESDIPSAIVTTIWRSAKIIVSISGNNQVLQYSGYVNNARVYSNNNCVVTIEKNDIGGKIYINTSHSIVSRNEYYSETDQEFMGIVTKWSDNYIEIEYKNTQGKSIPAYFPIQQDWFKNPIKFNYVDGTISNTKMSGYIIPAQQPIFVQVFLGDLDLQYLTRSQKWIQFEDIKNVSDKGSYAITFMNAINMVMQYYAYTNAGYIIENNDVINDNYSQTLINQKMVEDDNVSVIDTQHWEYNNGVNPVKYRCQDMEIYLSDINNADGLAEDIIVSRIQGCINNHKPCLVCLQNKNKNMHYVLAYKYRSDTDLTYDSIMVYDPGAVRSGKYAEDRTLGDMINKYYKGYVVHIYRVFEYTQI